MVTHDYPNDHLSRSDWIIVTYDYQNSSLSRSDYIMADLYIDTFQ
jgi:hypothetical protein